MKLYDILMRHAGPKSQVEFVLTRVLADSEEAILDRLDDPKGPYTYGGWTDKSRGDDGESDDDNEVNEDGHPLFEIHDADFKVIGKETWLQRMLRLRGEYNDPDADWDDAYYGIKHYGWSEGREISAEDVAVLQRLGLVEDWRTGAAA